MTTMFASAWLDPALHSILRGSLSLLLLSAAGHKLRDLDEFSSAVGAYDLVPRRLRVVAARLLVGVEVFVGLTLLLPHAAPALAAAVLLTTYTSAIAINLLRGRRNLDCGCAGPTQRLPIGPALVVRNTLLIAAALIVATLPTPRALVWLDAVTIIGGIAMLSLLYVAAETALANTARQRDRVVDRIVGHLASVSPPEVPS